MTKKVIKHRVTDLELDEVSLVDAPANPGARVLLLKRDQTGGAHAHGGQDAPGNSNGDDAMTTTLVEKISKALDDLEKALKEAGDDAAGSTQAADLRKQFDTLSKENADLAKAQADLQKQKADLEKANAELKKKAGDDGGEPEDVFKGLPKEVRERLEKAESVAKAQAERIEKMETDRQVAERIAKSAPLVEHLPAKADEVGGLLHRIEKGATTTEDAALTERLLKAANEAAAAANITKEYGSGAPPVEGSAAAEIETKAGELRKQHPEFSAPKARAEVRKQHPDLAKRERAEQRSAA